MPSAVLMLAILLFGTAVSASEPAVELKIASLPTGDSWKNGCGVATENSRFVFRLEGHEAVVVSATRDAHISLPADKPVTITIFLNDEEFDSLTYSANSHQPSCLVYNPVQGDWVWWGASGTCKSPF